MTGQKSNPTFDWEDVRCFAALARHGTLAATSRSLKVNPATVLRRLARLEAMLGSPLFTRNARGYALTAAGVSALGEAAQMEMAACALMSNGIVRCDMTGACARSHRSSAKANRE